MAMKHGGRGPGHISRWTAAVSPIPFLFASGAAGAWFDFTDTSTWYQDAARTTPAATLGDVVGGIADKSGRGNHASQATTAQKPLRARIPLGGRRNMLLYTEDWTNASWIQAAVSVTASTIIPTAASAQHKVTQTLTGCPATNYCTVYAKPAGYDWILLQNDTGFCYFNVSAGTVGSATGVTGAIAASTDGYFRCSINGTVATNNFIVWVTNANGVTTFTGDGTSGVQFRGAQLESGSSATGYQKVVAAWDVTESGVTSIPALYYDGSDDSLATAAIDFTGTDAVTVFAGVEKLSDAAQGCVVELTASTAANNGSFLLAAPDAATATFAFDSKGTTQVDAVATGNTSPKVAVLTGYADISADQCVIRVNGADADTDTGDQGTGNYSNAALYIGRRASTSIPFKGYMIGHMVIVGKLANASEIAAVEATERAATGAY